MSAEDFVVLNDEIRAFVRAGIPLDIGLRGTASRSTGALREVSNKLADRLQSGATIEQALSGDDARLPAAYRAVLTAGLKTGRIDDVLASLSELAESTTSLRRQLRLSLIYPAVLLILAYGLLVAFVIYVVPQMQRTYAIFEMQESNWMRALTWLHRTAAIWAVAVPVIVAGLLLLSWLIRRIRGGGTEGLLQSGWIPGSRDMSLARFSRVLSLLVEHRVPLPEGCRLSGEAAGDDRLRRDSEQLASALERGMPLQEALDQTSQLPSFLRWLIAVGEQQGAPAASLRQAAAVYEQKALSKLGWFRSVVPPLIVVLCCGTITLLYGLTLFLPLSALIKQMGIG